MSLVLAEDRAAVRHVVLNRPEKRNALASALVEELGAALRAAAGEPAVRVVVLRGEGAMFSSGPGSVTSSTGQARGFRWANRSMSKAQSRGTGDEVRLHGAGGEARGGAAQPAAKGQAEVGRRCGRVDGHRASRHRGTC